MGLKGMKKHVFRGRASTSPIESSIASSSSVRPWATDNGFPQLWTGRKWGKQEVAEAGRCKDNFAVGKLNRFFSYG